MMIQKKTIRKIAFGAMLLTAGGLIASGLTTDELQNGISLIGQAVTAVFGVVSYVLSIDNNHNGKPDLIEKLTSDTESTNINIDTNGTKPNININTGATND